MTIDPYILIFSAVTVGATIFMGFWTAKRSKTASDFFVAGRSVSVGWNASAISGEYLSAASFMGIAGMVMSSGYDALWYPVCYACGYLFLLLFIAGPLRRFGAYTIPDFAEGRFDSPVFRKIAVVFVLFIGFFYTMPQMKGAGTTLAYIFPGLPYWAGVVLVGAVITLNVALGGMKGITLVQAFQYWAKMFAISVPIFVLMAVYGHYGKQLEARATPYVLDPVAFVNGRAHVNQRLYIDPLWKDKFQVTDGGIPSKTEGLPLQAKLRVLLDEAGLRGRQSFAQPTWTGLHLSSQMISRFRERRIAYLHSYDSTNITITVPTGALTSKAALRVFEEGIIQHRFCLVFDLESMVYVIPTDLTNRLDQMFIALPGPSFRQPLPEKAPKDETWLNPFGPLTTKAAKNAAAAIGKQAAGRDALLRVSNQGGAATPPYHVMALRAGLSPDQRMTVNLDSPTVAQALGVFAELTGRQLLPNTNSLSARVDDFLGGKLSQLKIISRPPAPDSGVREHGDGAFTAAEVKAAIEAHLRTNGLALVAVGANGFGVQRAPGILPVWLAGQSSAAEYSTPPARQDAGGTLGATAEKAWLAKHEKPLALLYTYSLIIAIVCGTAGLPHILVRFYTNPDGTAAKKTTMWVMILIGVFYIFPPVFGALGRNLLPELYSGVGAKGTDKIVLELPRILNAKYPPLGSILSGITCAGAFAAFMSTFSGLLVSMTGALAHDVYGRILRPKATPQQRMRMFKIGAVIIGGVSILLGMQVEQLQINFMVGQAFAIAAASYFPLLFMAVWWRGLTMKGAATGMLTGGLLALAGISLTSFSDLAAAPNASRMFLPFAALNPFWAAQPLLRILCEQPAIWAVPLAITLMVIVSKLTAKEVPSDSRMKMLVLHAPEELGLKQEYIQEHQAPH